MIKEKTRNNKIVHKSTILVSIGLGAFHGFYDGMGISLPNKTLETYLIFGPSIIRGILGFYDGVSIARTGKQISGNYSSDMEEDFKNILEKVDITLNKSLYGGLLGGMGEGIVAGVHVCLGYLIGKTSGGFS